MTKEMLINETKRLLIRAEMLHSCSSLKGFMRDFIIADNYITLLLEHFDYDFIDHTPSFSTIYSYCVRAYSNIKIKGSI